VRVVAGSARGRRLVAPKGLTVRPTSDRVREATFNALASRGALRDSVVLDLFAGTGALAIEALSRGAARAVLVESDRAAVEAIRANLTATGMDERATVVRDDVLRWLGRPVPPVDLVLADPPYAFEAWEALLRAVHPALAASAVGLAVVETADAFTAPDWWEILREQRYGGTVVTILQPAVQPTVS
jgi:16S rRNA (guanine966-N2)-methyltransferase